MRLIFFLGNHPELAHKEIEACATILPFLWSASMLRAGVLQLKPSGISTGDEVSENTVLELRDPLFMAPLQQLQTRLGGTIKIAAITCTVERRGILLCLQSIVQQLKPVGRFTFGISGYGNGFDTLRMGLDLKKMLKKGGVAARLVPPKEGMALSSAQVFHNELDLARDGVEFNLISEGERVHVALTLTVQDIDAYGKRDFALPAPDPVSGMLPPKLAQSLINLAARNEDVAVYDPFCGNGRIVLEAQNMGLEAFGSDSEEGKIVASRKNLNWLLNNNTAEKYFWVQDARKREGIATINQATTKDYVIAAEPYLGPPLRRPLRTQEVEGWLKSLSSVYVPYLQTWSKGENAEKMPLRQVLVFPTAKCEDGTTISLYRHLVDTLDRFRYGHYNVSHYARPDALVGRDIVVLN